ncbi:BZ3500_MvSof-1268-A1-R1_Chr2-3g05277 [Microbotryum saponariae]|uniref:BZ3500_MvSof-1268-A1-R1_Chr2-3g05277 protein n=1 Tax=Microbotryum saponariae TaxID=289078 RepID=A0A2X0LPR1_9BASI|nr:BZ3500_MvSof-1268-A1-R1_Chr2-3g05277 [Microbotryum saponariae]SDA01103.1 BZ3501_MvSof-1269-A2-R1_Chr2-2g04950 [Microbotryum saponariae]
MLALPAPETRSADDPIRLNVSTGESYSLYERLGPTIVASDGTLSRIGNWAEMDELERSRVLRVLGKRNQIRLEAKRNEQELEQHQRRTEAGTTDEGDIGRPAP